MGQWSVLVLLLSAAICVAQATPTTQPARPPGHTVLVLPFTSPAQQGYEWVGRGVQEDLLADLTPHLRGAVTAPAGAAAAADADAALKAAHTRGAAVVVFGNAQADGDQLRLTGQVLEVSSGKALAGLKATGTTHTVFRLEDAIAAQVIRALPLNLLSRQSLGMLRRDATPATFATEPQGGAYVCPAPTVVLSPPQLLDATLSLPTYPMLSGPGWYGYGNPRAPTPRAYPFSYYHPYLHSSLAPDPFIFVNVRRGH